MRRLSLDEYLTMLIGPASEGTPPEIGVLDMAGVGHWRTRDGDEVDLVVERDDGAIIGFRVKAAGRVPSDDFKPLRKLRALTGDSFHAGVVLYTGSRSYNFEDRLHVMAIDRLWT